MSHGKPYSGIGASEKGSLESIGEWCGACSSSQEFRFEQLINPTPEIRNGTKEIGFRKQGIRIKLMGEMTVKRVGKGTIKRR